MLDFAIKYDDVLLDIEDDSYLTVEWYSTVFNEAEILRGSFSYPVNMKWTDKNLVALGFPNIISNRIARKKVNVSVLLFGVTWKNAEMEIEISYERIQGTLLIDNSIISETIKENTLPDMFSFLSAGKKQYEEINIGSTVTEKRTHMLSTALFPDRHAYAFPSMTNFSALGERTLEESAWINSFDWKSPYSNAYHLHNNNFYNPSFYLVWLIKSLCTKLGFEAVGSFLDHSEVRRWIIYNTGYYSGREIKHSNFRIIPARHLPKLSVSDFIKILRNDLKVMIYFDSLTRKAHFELSESILLQENVYDYSGKVVDKTLKTIAVKDKAFNVIGAIDDADESFTYLKYVKSIRIGEGNLKNVELSIGSVFMNSGIFTAYTPHPLRQPQVSQIANIYDVEFSSLSCYNKPGELSKNDFTFRIFSFRGLVSNDASHPGYSIPYGTSDNRNPLNEVEEGWIPTMMGQNSLMEIFCGMFFRFLIWTEVIEFNSYIPPQDFYNINPMRLGLIEDTVGSKSRFLIDRISFEPIRGVSHIFSKVKGYLYHKVFGLSDIETSTFQVHEENEPEDMVYIGWRFIERRWVDESDGQAQLAKVQLLFFADPFLMNPKWVTGLEVKYALERTFSNGTIDYLEEQITTGTNVIDYVSEEVYIFSNVGGGRMDVSVVVRESDNESYIPI